MPRQVVLRSLRSLRSQGRPFGVRLATTAPGLPDEKSPPSRLGPAAEAGTTKRCGGPWAVPERVASDQRQGVVGPRCEQSRLFVNLRMNSSALVVLPRGAEMQAVRQEGWLDLKL